MQDPETLYAIVPFIDLPQMTAQAIDDLLAQEGLSVRVLAISNGSSYDTRKELEARQRSQQWRGAVRFWWHHPPLETLNATWNAALEFVWAAGGERALVVNNDVRLAPWTAAELCAVQGSTSALLVSAVGVREKEFTEYLQEGPYTLWDSDGTLSKGGPDFSCFLITKECHEKYPFDESFTYCGDCDLHRRVMLAGEGSRIFSVNVPYLHYASQTIKQASPERQAYYAEQSALHHTRYQAKWGGDVNGERFRVPHDPASAEEWITNPELQARG